MRKPNPLRHAAQRAHLLQAARRCFARSGFDGTSTETIRVEAATSSGKLFHYFPSKRVLILAVVEEYQQQTLQWLADLAKRRDPEQALRALLSGIVKAAADPLERRLILEINAAASRDEAIAEMSAASDRAIAQTLAALIARRRYPFVLSGPQMVTLLATWIDGVFSRASCDPGFDPPTMHDSIEALLAALERPHMEKNHD